MPIGGERLGLERETPDYKMLIGGAWVDALSGKTFESINPYTGRGAKCPERSGRLMRRFAALLEQRNYLPGYRSNLHFHVVAGYAHFVGGRIFPGRKHLDLPRPDVEAGAVPGTLDLISLDPTLAQRSTHMGAVVVEGVDLTPHLEQGDPTALDLDVGAMVLGKMRFPGDFDESAHEGPPLLSFQIAGWPSPPSGSRRRNLLASDS
jgi:hypothetical protein